MQKWCLKITNRLSWSWHLVGMQEFYKHISDIVLHLDFIFPNGQIDQSLDVSFDNFSVFAFWNFRPTSRKTIENTQQPPAPLEVSFLPHDMMSNELSNNADECQTGLQEDIRHSFGLELQEDIRHIQQLFIVFQALEEKLARGLQCVIEILFTLI